MSYSQAKGNLFPGGGGGGEGEGEGEENIFLAHEKAGKTDKNA